ncbi:light-harvesting complex-like protein OHP1, chloroplastic [Silene latifolia]|uniref:light-harvesting complex-like protein OHP1, chloroplastic n=1 Tax=Silene latifolia TaxID=37657 RepID=UPI003D785403
MAATVAYSPANLGLKHHNKHELSTLRYGLLNNRTALSLKRVSFSVQAAKLPPGVVLPKAEPKFNAPFLGFTKTAEVWNSRACMIGLIGTFIVELILNKGILELIGVEIGKGLDIPL